LIGAQIYSHAMKRRLRRKAMSSVNQYDLEWEAPALEGGHYKEKNGEKHLSWVRRRWRLLGSFCRWRRR
jgi:hypothetical protein